MRTGRHVIDATSLEKQGALRRLKAGLDAAAKLAEHKHLRRGPSTIGGMDKLAAPRRMADHCGFMVLSTERGLDK